MLTLLAPLLSIAALGLYFLLCFRFAVWRRVPWEFLAVTFAGAGLGVYQVARAPGVATAAGAVLAVGVAAFGCWFIFSFSLYGAREDRPRPGDPFPDFSLPASDGTRFALGDAHGRRLLILFYRGAW